MILKFCKPQQKKFRLKPIQKPYLECVWSKPGNKTSVKYSLAPLCQVRDLPGLIKEPFTPGRICWGWSRGCSLQAHCNTPSKLQPDRHSQEEAAISHFGNCTAMDACSSTQIWLAHSGARAPDHSGYTALTTAQIKPCSLWGKWDSFPRKLFSGSY